MSAFNALRVNNPAATSIVITKAIWPTATRFFNRNNSFPPAFESEDRAFFRISLKFILEIRSAGPNAKNKEANKLKVKNEQKSRQSINDPREANSMPNRPATTDPSNVAVQTETNKAAPPPK